MNRLRGGWLKEKSPLFRVSVWAADVLAGWLERWKTREADEVWDERGTCCLRFGWLAWSWSVGEGEARDAVRTYVLLNHPFFFSGAAPAMFCRGGAET